MSTAPGSGVTGSPALPTTRIGALPSASRSRQRRALGVPRGAGVEAQAAEPAPNSGYLAFQSAARSRTSLLANSSSVSAQLIARLASSRLRVGAVVEPAGVAVGEGEQPGGVAVARRRPAPGPAAARRRVSYSADRMAVRTSPGVACRVSPGRLLGIGVASRPAASSSLDEAGAGRRRAGSRRSGRCSWRRRRRSRPRRPAACASASSCAVDVGVDRGVEHQRAHLVGEQLGVGGAERGAVGVAEVGQLLVAEGLRGARSMSRAVSTVLKAPSASLVLLGAALRRPPRPGRRRRPAARRLVGRGLGREQLGPCCSSEMHSTGVDSPTPRGSKPTMSNRLQDVGRAGSAPGRSPRRRRSRPGRRG